MTGVMLSVTGICITVGTLVGSLLPAVWGGSELSLTSVLFGAIGGIAGLVVARRLLD